MVAFSKLPVMMSDEDVVDKKYENGKIYVVKCKYDNTLVYVGSTIMTLDERFKKHKINNFCSLYQYVNDIGDDWNNWYIELYEDYPCKNKYILEKRETEVQRQIATINKQFARRSKKEYREDNREKLSEQHKQYHQDNREKRLERMKQYDQDNREKLSEQHKQYHQDNRDKILEYQKQYHQDNREKRLEQMKQYDQKNREKISEYRKQPTTCDRCGSIISKKHIAKHKRTAKCLNIV